MLKRITEVSPVDSVKRKGGSGRPHKLNRRQKNSIVKAIENRRGPSTRTQSKKFGVTQQTIRNTLQRAGVQKKNRQKVPKMDAGQQQRVMERCQLLSTHYFPIGGQVHIVIDDESYFYLKSDKTGTNTVRIQALRASTLPSACRHRARFRCADLYLSCCAHVHHA